LCPGWPRNLNFTNRSVRTRMPGGVADDWGERGGGRGGGELVDLGFGRGEGAVAR